MLSKRKQLVNEILMVTDGSVIDKNCIEHNLDRILGEAYKDGYEDGTADAVNISVIEQLELKRG